RAKRRGGHGSQTDEQSEFESQIHQIVRRLEGDSRSNFRLIEHLLDRRCDPTLIVAQGHAPARPAQIVGCISHNKWITGKGKHLNVIVIVSNGHDLRSWDFSISSPALHRMTL